ncbi:glycosyltransferase family 2 protein [Marinimicrobium agarilyticum]|uniref:glycosyltransferase family 2 protein n=1 Tax=Marinimicrobium agarilyticum TaxID=306546 RepID=UPI0004115DC1|nr:glycosyltransferase family 2 protein [Marinimicrobium agarilyticum]
MLEFWFWLLAFGAVFSYFIYPLLLSLANVFFGKKLDIDGDEPSHKLTVIVTAYNEESRIREKILNTLALKYPADKLELVVASDCSEDGTDRIVQEYADQGVKLVRATERLGKENAQREAIESASGDILVFSDVATEIPDDALMKLERYFQDDDVGAVSSEDRFVSQDGKVAGEGAYVKYEMWLRRLESRLYGLVGLSGSFFAARKSICKDWDIHSPSDFNTALNTAKAGKRAVTASDVLGYYKDLKDAQKEYQRKVRTVLRGMVGLSRHTEVLNPFTLGGFAFQTFSHKIMRWLVPWFLLGTFLTSAALSTEGAIYALALWVQLGFYGIAIAAHFLPNLRSTSLIKIIYFFVQVNVAIFESSIKFLSGQRMTKWTPSAR